MFFGPSDSGAVKSVHESLSKLKVPHEVLKAEDVNKRFDALNLPINYVCVLEEGAGILRASVAVHALQVNFACTVVLQKLNYNVRDKYITQNRPERLGTLIHTLTLTLTHD